jgi:CSLREA domain-containing protein
MMVTPSARAATIVVDTLADTQDSTDSTTSLREAILLANSTPAHDKIVFNIDNLAFGPPPHTIMVGIPPGIPLPLILYPTEIDGTSEPDYIVTGTISVVLDGTNALASNQAALLFEPGSDGSTVRGLGIQNFIADAIVFQTGDNTVELNAIEGNGGTGVVVSENKNAKIIGNLISGNGGNGIYISGVTSPLWGYCRISENAITANAKNGVLLSSGHNSVRDNTISANGDNGIQISGSFANENDIRGNFVGTDQNGLVLGNTNFGIVIGGSGNIIGGLGARHEGGSLGNVIAYNGKDGVRIASGRLNTIRGNSIHGNGWLGIDLAPAGVTQNDAGQDVDTGANDLQNYPELVFASPFGGSMVVRLKFHSNLATAFRIDFYTNQQKDPTGYGEGQTYHHTYTLTTPALPHTILADVTMPSAPMGYYITATATDQLGNTSEFSNAVQNGSRVRGNEPPNP